MDDLSKKTTPTVLLFFFLAVLASFGLSNAIDTSAVFAAWQSTLTIPGSTGAAIILRNNTAAYADQASAETALDTATSCSGSASTISSLCTTSLHPCHANADCTSPATSLATCQCKSGYTDTSTATYPPTNLVPSGTNCEDINECSTSAHNCHSDANCTNTAGSFTCACKTGFTGDGVSCTDINECSTSDICHSDADCTNTPGSFTCTCQTGFTGDGASCTAIATTTVAPTTTATTAAAAPPSGSSAPNLLPPLILTLFFGTLYSALDSVSIVL